MDEDECRCELTLDIEEWIMKNKKEATMAKAVATYNSGRTEEFDCKLRACGNPTKSFLERVSALRNFPTVKDVEVEHI